MPFIFTNSPKITFSIGIDVGITLLSAENLRSGSIWRYFMRNREIPNALRLVGLVEVRGHERMRHTLRTRAMYSAPFLLSGRWRELMA